MAVVELAGAAAVERDRTNPGMGSEQRVDRIRGLAADRGVGAGPAFGRGADIPERDPPCGDKAQLFGVVGRRAQAEQAEGDRPEQVARVGVIFDPAQRFFARQRAEDEDKRPRVDDRREAAFGGVGGRAQSM